MLKFEEFINENVDPTQFSGLIKEVLKSKGLYKVTCLVDLKGLIITSFIFELDWEKLFVKNDKFLNVLKIHNELKNIAIEYSEDLNTKRTVSYTFNPKDKETVNYFTSHQGIKKFNL